MKLAGEYKVANVLIDFGQDVGGCGRSITRDYWRVGLEDPAQPGKCWVGVVVTGQAVATSGDYIRHAMIEGKRYSHLIDPRNGYPVDNEVRAASIIAPTCTIAGLFSTATCILGAREGARLVESHPSAAGAIITDTNKIFTLRFHEYVPKD